MNESSMSPLTMNEYQVLKNMILTASQSQTLRGRDQALQWGSEGWESIYLG